LGEFHHGGRLIADHLAAEGVDALFTLTGGHISAIYDGCKDAGIRVIDVRHEQAAAHAADAYGRLTFRPGVAAVTAGPGVTDAITGVTNAFYANSPMVLLGVATRSARGDGGAAGRAADRAVPARHQAGGGRARDPTAPRGARPCRSASALTPRMGPTYVDVPMDVLMTPVDTDHVVGAAGQRFTTTPGARP
jgi:acetolactate synthase I/II/III large subunit